MNIQCIVLTYNIYFSYKAKVTSVKYQIRYPIKGTLDYTHKLPCIVRRLQNTSPVDIISTLLLL